MNGTKTALVLGCVLAGISGCNCGTNTGLSDGGNPDGGRGGDAGTAADSGNPGSDAGAGDSGSVADGGNGQDAGPGLDGGANIKTVFLIMMENHDWSSITSSGVPYINNTLLDAGAWATQYYNPPGNHPSEPNYLWLEAGTNFGILDDNDPCTNHQAATHLATLLTQAAISWKAYQEDIPDAGCPVNDTGEYAVRHNPFVYFDDVTGPPPGGCTWPNTYAGDETCQAHVRPYYEFLADLSADRVPRYNFITPNLINDMHDGTIQDGDNWLAANIPLITASAAYRRGGAIIITWDEGEGDDGPIGLIVLSPFIRAPGYFNSVAYDHGSTLRTVQEIFSVTPLLGSAATATDLSDLFQKFP